MERGVKKSREHDLSFNIINQRLYVLDADQQKIVPKTFHPYAHVRVTATHSNISENIFLRS